MINSLLIMLLGLLFTSGQEITFSTPSSFYDAAKRFAYKQLAPVGESKINVEKRLGKANRYESRVIGNAIVPKNWCEAAFYESFVINYDCDENVRSVQFFRFCD